MELPVRSEAELREKIVEIKAAAVRFNVPQKSVRIQVAVLLWALGDVDAVWHGLELAKEQESQTTT